MKLNGQCHRVAPVTCKSNGELHPPTWVLTNGNQPPDHCERGKYGKAKKS